MPSRATCRCPRFRIGSPRHCAAPAAHKASSITAVITWRALYTVVCRLTLDLDPPLMYVKGVGPARAAMLEAKGLLTVEDLLPYAPFRYEDRSNVKTIAQLAPGEMATVIAEVQSRQALRFPPQESRTV